MGTFQTGITFKKGVLTNGSPLPGQDYISAMLFYNSSPPSLFPTSLVKQCFSIQDAINVGITNTHTDETASTATYALSADGAAGDVISIYCQEPINPINTATNPNKVLLCTYTRLSSDSSTTLLGASIAAAINANAANNGGYSAVSATGTITITARPGLGLALNSGSPYSVVIVGTIAGTLTQNVVAGVASKLDVYYYHISEYFRLNPNGNLFVGIYPTSDDATFASVTTMQTYAVGAIRQIAIYNPARTVVSNIVADANTLNTVCQALDTNKMPLSAVLVEDMHSVSDLTTLPNLALLNDEWVSINISQDGSAQGWALYEASALTISNIGALLGTISINSVSADIAQPIPLNNISNGAENAYPVLGNNTAMNSVSFGLQTLLDNYRYIYSNSYVGSTGTYFNDSHCAIISNSNYAYIEQNRVEAKIERILYQAYLPYLKSQLQLNSDGTLTNVLVAALQSVGNNALAVMVQDNELSAVSTIVNPLQNVVTSGKLVVTLYEINNPIARNIEVDINSVTNI